MTAPEDLERRVAALEERVSLEAGMRAAVDMDVSAQGQRIQVLSRLVQAVATTQGEHTKTLAEHTQTLRELKAGQHQIIGLLNTLIQGDSGEEGGSGSP